MMNRKGQVAFLMMFLVAIVLVVSTMYIFISFSGGFSDLSLQNSMALSNVEFGSSYVTSNAKIAAGKAILSTDPDKIKLFRSETAKLDLQVYEAGNYFKQVSEGKFEF